MKIFLLAMTLLSFNVFAQRAGIQVGEYSRHKVTVAGLEGVIVSKIDSFDVSTNLYKVSTTTDLQGRRTVEYASTPEDEMWTHQSGKDALSFCPMLGGVLENVSFAGKSYQTCKLPVQGEKVHSIIKFFGFPLPQDARGDVWIGDFAVNGIYKMTTDVYNLQLVDMKWNQ